MGCVQLLFWPAEGNSRSLDSIVYSLLFVLYKLLDVLYIVSTNILQDQLLLHWNKIWECLTACSFDLWLMPDADLFWLADADLFWLVVDGWFVLRQK
jgi:hypothetical protein